MSHPIAPARIQDHPLFTELVSRRRRFVGWLTAATVLPYALFVLVVGFDPQLLARKLSATGVINIAWPLGLALIVGAWLLTGLYVLRANGEFDALTAEILAGARQ